MTLTYVDATGRVDVTRSWVPLPIERNVVIQSAVSLVGTAVARVVGRELSVHTLQGEDMDVGDLIELMGNVEKQLTDIRVALGNVETNLNAIRSKKLVSMPSANMPTAILSYWDTNWKKLHTSPYFKPGTRADEKKLADGIWKAAQNHGLGIKAVYDGIHKFQTSNWGCGKDFRVFYSSCSQYIMKTVDHKKMKKDTEKKRADRRQEVFQSDMDYANENAATPKEMREILNDLPWRKNGATEKKA